MFEGDRKVVESVFFGRHTEAGACFQLSGLEGHYITVKAEDEPSGKIAQTQDFTINLNLNPVKSHFC